MGLMDKAKAQMSNLAQSANAGMARLDAMPVQRRADALLRSLGIAVLAERTGRSTPETQAQITQLLADLAQHEAQNNVNLVQQAAQAQMQAQQMQAQQMQMQQMQTPGQFLTSAPAADLNVPGGMPGAPAPGYGGVPAYGGQPGFPGAAPSGFPQQGGQPGFPGAAPSGFPQEVPMTSFPPASPLGPAGSADEGTSDQAQSSFPGSGFPPASGV
jgi:hypothetical protein